MPSIEMTAIKARTKPLRCSATFSINSDILRRGLSSSLLFNASAAISSCSSNHNNYNNSDNAYPEMWISLNDITSPHLPEELNYEPEDGI